jgi:preprotein translocase subunit SecF
MFTLIPHKTSINFVGARYIGFVISSILMLLGVIGVWRIATGHAKMAIDFSGGTNVTVMLEKPVSTEELRALLKPSFPDADLQQVQGQPEYMIRIRKAEGDTTGTASQVGALLAKGLPGNKLLESSSEEVGPAVSGQLRAKAFWAVLWSLVFITVYIAFRFDFRFSIGAFVATIHDVLAVTGIMVLLGHDFSLLLVTALLTLAGYSLTDTVVVFDRIRENMRLHRSENFASLVNTSINETLSRTINTSMTVLLVVLVLFLYGGEVVHDFSMALLLGVVVGTYSSIFVASPLVVEWNLRSPQRS